MRNKLIAGLPLLWLLAIPVLNVWYGILNRGGPNVGSLMTDLDYAIPFVPAFIIPYVLWYPFILFMFFVFFARNRPVYYRSLAAVCAGLVVCYIVYATFQTTISRPIVEQDGPIFAIVRTIYATDAPFNCFPSIHVFTCHVILKGSYSCGLKKSVQWTIFVIAWAIIASTVLVKQHALLDVAGAILLSELLCFVFGKREART
ncbi:inositol phosphorylceramide synthase [Paenibacillus flagellatus]|uniref:Inositol phosphorylceramide synthase n=1 Tax=Paenibacillus flagellatus TaxID=2211139 RepID=A0A2V5KAF2_9BACL|nr:inositol phosphorylceramide synthase [Paenibacillus flagellatus]PYI56559.1 inositol phosphorylceramide synthase [Paenibacillus flagellatus]